LNKFHSSNWFLPSQTHTLHIDPNVRSWLSDEGSLTKRLKQLCPAQFSVAVVGTQWVRPELSEAKLLDIPTTQRVMLREVYLKCSDELCVYARSVIPLRTLQGKHRRLKYLGNKPLGEYLFACPGLTRKAIQWSKLTCAMPLYQTALNNSKNNSQPVWGRRSLFCMDKYPLLVSEFFLPALFDYSK
jgi:chorismate lyase